MNAPCAVPAMARAQQFQRHDWVWCNPAQLADQLPASVASAARVWAATAPLVVARRGSDDLLEGRLQLGFCQPDPVGGKPLRYALQLPESAVWQRRPGFSVEEGRHRLSAQPACLPPAWAEALDRLCRWQDQHDLILRLYGSAAWSLFGAIGCVRPGSDLDLLIDVPPDWTADHLHDVCTGLDALSQQLESRGGPRLDGELRLSGWGDCAWREYQQRPDWLLCKDAVSVGLQPRPAQLLPPDAGLAPAPALLDALACAALREEAMAWPKPGLVSPVDRGSHADMDIHLLLTAIAALRGWFAEFARSARAGGTFADMVSLGRAAEAAMLVATGGINAYRGAIFNLGLLVAAAALGDRDPCLGVARRWGEALRQHAGRQDSHGATVRARHRVGGAPAEAAAGFPVLMQHALPAYRQAQQLGLTADRRIAAACLASMAVLDDTNLLWRGGEEGLHWVRQQAAALLAAGGVFRTDWCAPLVRLHQGCVARHLSPGGSADLAGCAAFLAALPTMPKRPGC